AVDRKGIILTETQGGPTNSEKVTGVVCPGLRSVESYTCSNRKRESTGVIDQNAGTAEALDCEDLGGAGRDRDVLSDTCRHMEFADNRTYGDIGLIAECAVEAGGL